MKKYNQFILHVVCMTIVISITSCQPSKNTETVVVDSVIVAPEEWISLFDGKTLNGWRSYNEDTLKEGWVVEDGMMKALGQGADAKGYILFDSIQFEDFELTFEWKISQGGNSGIMYHVVEDVKYKLPYETGPEYQLIDDLNFPEKLEDWQMNAADYGMYPANPETKQSKNSGEWNSTRIIFQKDKVEYWLNDQMVVSFVPWSEDWLARKSSGKWNEYPDYGMAKKGYFVLQDHGNVAWFRNLKARYL